MLIYYSGNGKAPIEPEIFLKGKGSLMLTYAECGGENEHQARRFKLVRKARRKAKKK